MQNQNNNVADSNVADSQIGHLVEGMMNNEKLQALLPKCGLDDLLNVYMTWSGVGFFSVIVANQLDELSGTTYATHFTDALNVAVGLHFWLLIGSIGLLLFCLTVPVVYSIHKTPEHHWISEKLRFFTYTFFLVAFCKGALMAGILCGTMLGISERAYLIISKSFLFSENSFTMLCLLLMGNTVLWWLGESIYNRNDKSYSGIVSWILRVPLKYSVPCYVLLTSLFVTALINQQ